MPGHRIAPLAIEAQKAGQTIFRRAVTIRGINRLLMLTSGYRMQNRTLQIRGQQYGLDRPHQSLLLRQWLPLVLKHRVPYLPLHLSG
ncbi:hypothetical protein D3C85_1522470 [compost metagenome]